jgi:PAS domain S-box-containing protein
MALANAEAGPATDELFSVLVIDDDEDDYLITLGLLWSTDRFAVRVDWEANYQDGLEALTRQEHDVYLIDYRLGATSGLDLLREAVTAGCRAPMIVLTGRGDYGVAIEAMEAGAADYLVKGTVDRDGLERSIRYALERHRTLAAVREAEERFRQAFNNAPIGMALVDSEGRFAQVNPALCSVLGYAEEDLFLKSFEEITHPDDQQSTRAAMRDLLSGRVESIEMLRRYTRADGSVALGNTSASVCRESQGGLFLVVQLADITDLKVANRRLRELLDSKDSFLAAVSHELRTPLTAVMGFAELLREGTGIAAAEQGAMIQAIAEEAVRLSDLVDDLLVAARAESGELSVTEVPVDLVAQVEQVLEAMARTLVKPVEVVGGGVKAQADPARVRQIVRNLVANAQAYGGRHITVRVEESESASVVKVIDDGAGIPTHERDRIFDAYYRAHHPVGTTGSVGLGLAVSRELAKLMGGDLQYRYEQGESTFELTLPPHSAIAAFTKSSQPQ